MRYSQGFDLFDEYSDENDILEKLNDTEQEYDNPILAVSHYEPQDEKRICKFLRASGGCWKGTECRFSHEPLDPGGWTTDRQLVYNRVFNKLELPSPGMTARVKVVFIDDLTTFYVRIISYPDMQKPSYQPVNNLKGLHTMMNTPEEQRTFTALTVVPADGELVLVKHNDSWHRGQVIERTDRCDETYLTVILSLIKNMVNNLH